MLAAGTRGWGHQAALGDTCECLLHMGEVTGLPSRLPCFGAGWHEAGGTTERGRGARALQGSAAPPGTPITPSPSLQAQRHVNDLYEDLRDGHNLISLLEVLSGDTLVGPAPILLPHRCRPTPLHWLRVPGPSGCQPSHPLLPASASYPSPAWPLPCLPSHPGELPGTVPQRPEPRRRGRPPPSRSSPSPTAASNARTSLCFGELSASPRWAPVGGSALTVPLRPLPPSSLCTALAGQPRERDVIRNLRLVSGSAVCSPHGPAWQAPAAATGRRSATGVAAPSQCGCGGEAPPHAVPGGGASAPQGALAAGSARRLSPSAG